MKPETAAAIAKKIGVTFTDEYETTWEDQTGWMRGQISTLPIYLATGDRPLRVFETMVNPGLRPPGLSCSDVYESEWWCVADNPRKDEYQRATVGTGATPAAAILACAAALEEGNESLHRN